MTPPLKHEDVDERLVFAKRRLIELLSLNHGNLQSADSSQRQQLMQEFFFHLVGATEVLAQLVNDTRALGVNSELVGVSGIGKKLPALDAVKPILGSLHVVVRLKPLPKDPYNDAGYIFRILNYRHQVTQRRRNPIFTKVGVGSAPADGTVYLLLDPRNLSLGPSAKSLQEDMRHMLELVKNQCENALSKL